MTLFDRIAEYLTKPRFSNTQPEQVAFCPRCSSRLFYLKVRAVWRCDAHGHVFSPFDHSVARFKVPE